jgi:hypothetical protein
MRLRGSLGFLWCYVGGRGLRSRWGSFVISRSRVQVPPPAPVFLTSYAEVPLTDFLVACSEVAAGCIRQAIDGAPVGPGYEVPVEVDGDLDRRVAELLLHVGERFATLDQQRGVCVPQIVEADPAQPRFSSASLGGIRPSTTFCESGRTW